MKQMWKATTASHLVGLSDGNSLCFSLQFRGPRSLISYHEPRPNRFTRLVRVRSNYDYMSEQHVSRTAFSPYAYNASTLK